MNKNRIFQLISVNIPGEIKSPTTWSGDNDQLADFPPAQSLNSLVETTSAYAMAYEKIIENETTDRQTVRKLEDALAEARGAIYSDIRERLTMFAKRYPVVNPDHRAEIATRRLCDGVKSALAPKSR